MADFARVNPDVELAIIGWQNGFCAAHDDGLDTAGIPNGSLMYSGFFSRGSSERNYRD